MTLVCPKGSRLLQISICSSINNDRGIHISINISINISSSRINISINILIHIRVHISSNMHEHFGCLYILLLLRVCQHYSIYKHTYIIYIHIIYIPVGRPRLMTQWRACLREATPHRLPCPQTTHRRKSPSEECEVRSSRPASSARRASEPLDELHFCC